MLYGLFWQEVFPWPTPEDETPECTSPVSGDYIAEVLDLEPGQVLPYCFECTEGSKLKFSVASTTLIDVVLCTGEQFEGWAEEQFDTNALSALEFKLQVQSASIILAIQAKSEYVVVLVNRHERPSSILVASFLSMQLDSTL